MSKRLDLVGVRFGRLVVIEREESAVSKSGKVRGRWLCQCDCGNECIVKTEHLRAGLTRSCGCYAREIRSRKTHGLAGTRIYTEWISMKDRCNNPNNSRYYRYGARGIKVCEEWVNSFENFYKWATGNGYTDKLTIERKNVDGDYCPDNCCWIPFREQAINRSTSLKIVDTDGKEKLAMDIAERNGIDMNVVRARVYKGWDMNDALNTPLIQQTVRRPVEQISLLTGEVIAVYKSIGEASKSTGVDRSSISRCCSGERNKVGSYAWRYAEVR